MTTKTDGTTPDTRQLAIRLPGDLVHRIEAHAERLRADLPGLAVTRTDAIRILLADALSYAEKQAASPTK